MYDTKIGDNKHNQSLILQAVMLPQEVFSLLNLEIVINDINDNGPKFTASRVVVNVSESVDVGEIFPLDQFQATDEDSGENSRFPSNYLEVPVLN